MSEEGPIAKTRVTLRSGPSQDLVAFIGGMATCSSCGGALSSHPTIDGHRKKVQPGEKMGVILANIINAEGAWVRRETYHPECYEASGHPHGKVENPDKPTPLTPHPYSRASRRSRPTTTPNPDLTEADQADLSSIKDLL